ncbi:MAG: hypothetical protein HY561_05780 [Gemmatimonadetes bacterium]|nr:hypothetical protein [Gemmatimonadota bacterium]
MKKSDNDLRPEYDFSGGVRGKYAEAYAKRVRFPGQSGLTLRLDVEAWLGHALTQAQALEATLVAYVALAHARSPQRAGKEVAALVEVGRSPLWRSFLADIRRYRFDSELASGLRDFFKERDWLVHRSWFEYGGAELSAGSANRLANRLERFARKAALLEQTCYEFLLKILTERGMSEQEVARRAAAVRERWLAA